MRHGDDLLLLQHPDSDHAVAAAKIASRNSSSTIRTSTAVVAVSVDSEQRKDAVDIAKQARRRMPELIPRRVQETTR